MIHVRVRAGDGLQLESMHIDCLNDGVRVISGIDADRAQSFLATDDARVLLESGRGDFFDDHDALRLDIYNSELTRDNRIDSFFDVRKHLNDRWNIVRAQNDGCDL